MSAAKDGAGEAGGMEAEDRGGSGKSRASNIQPRLLTLDDVATYLNVSSRQVYHLVRSGDLKAVKIGGRGVWRVDRAEVDAYIDRLHAETDEWTKSHPLNPSEQP